MKIFPSWKQGKKGHKREVREVGTNLEVWHPESHAAELNEGRPRTFKD
jgi:hypothetical protein